MKLGELRGAIRKCKGNPVVRVPLPGGGTMSLTAQKTVLLEELERLCPGGKNVETPFAFNPATSLFILPQVEDGGLLTQPQSEDDGLLV